MLPPSFFEPLIDFAATACVQTRNVKHRAVKIAVKLSGSNVAGDALGSLLRESRQGQTGDRSIAAF